MVGNVSSAKEMQLQEKRRLSARAYPMGKIKRIVIGQPTYRDAEGKACPQTPSQVTEQSVRSFLARAEAVSQISVMNYYGVHGECVRDPVEVFFADGRRARLAFAAESGVAYLSPLHNGRETDVFFYYCADCDQ